MLKAEFLLSKEKTRINLNFIFIFIIGFFIARASVLENLTPFGISFIGSLIFLKKENFFFLLSAILGSISFHILGGLDYILAYAIIFIVFSIFVKKNKSIIGFSVSTGLLFLLIRLSFIVIKQDFYYYDIFASFFESTIVLTMTYIFSKSMEIEDLKRTYSKEKIICSLITLGLIISGASNLAILGITIKKVMTVVIILFMSYKLGAFVGSGLGMLIGVISYLSMAEMPFILALYGLAGLIAGIFRDLGKMGSVLGFLLGNIIISYYINGYGTSFINSKELIVSFILFLLLYNRMDKLVNPIIEMASGRLRDKSYSEKKANLIQGKLTDMSNVFLSLGNVLESTIEKDKNMENIESLIEDTVNNVCLECGKCKSCWENKFYYTYESFLRLISIFENGGYVTESNMPENLKKICISKNELAEFLGSKYEIAKLNLKWNKLILENRALLAEQLVSVSKTLDKTINDVYLNPVFKRDLENEIIDEFLKENISVVDVMAIDYQGKWEIYIDMKEKLANEFMEDKITSIIASVLEADVKIEEKTRIDNRIIRFKLIKSNRFEAYTEAIVKVKGKDGISGDSYTYGGQDGYYYMAISDGMGSGAKAKEESTTAINLLEKFIEAKFDNEVALQTINSILLNKSNSEIFTTFDLSWINLQTGKLKIFKSGAPSTFLKTKDKIRLIRGQSLPVGMIKNVDINIYEEFIEDGEIIVMVSDGIMDAKEPLYSGESWIKNILENIDSFNPKSIGERIISEALKGDKIIKDDMTMLITKVWKAR